MEKTIREWIETLIRGDEMPLHIIDDKFYIEDGMSLHEYWKYESESFADNCEIFELDEDFSIGIKDIQDIGNNKSIVLFYIINLYDKIVFKLSVTLLDVGNGKYKISSNNFGSHIVAKHVLENKTVVRLGLAIKSSLSLERIICPELESLGLNKSSSFDEDNFHTVQFNASEENKNSFSFHLKYEGFKNKEKRVIFFDPIDEKYCPYLLNKDNSISTNDELYPVNLAIYYKNKTEKNFTYPRKIKESLVNVEKVIITDVLDNDWILTFD